MSVDYSTLIREVDDFPQAGCKFGDISPLLASPENFKAAMDELSRSFTCAGHLPDVVVAADARGFIVGTALAERLHVPLVLARKAGKLPPPVRSITYETEYSKDTIEMAERDFSGQRVLICDDVLATGGTVKAINDLLVEMGMNIEPEVAVILDVGLPVPFYSSINTYSLVSYND